MTQLTGHIQFSPDFEVESSQGQTPDPDALSLLLPTLLLCARTIGECFDCGHFLRFKSWSRGQGMVIREQGESIRHELYDAVTRWADLEEPEQPRRAAVTRFYPVWSELPQLLQYLRNSPELVWFGLRNNETNDWMEGRLEEGQPTPAQVKKATMTALQIDVLLKGQKLPRGRLRLDYEGSSLWVWASSMDDYLMILERVKEPRDHRVRLIGEAFLLHRATRLAT